MVRVSDLPDERTYLLSQVEQVIWVEGWQATLICWANGCNSLVKGDEGQKLFARCEGDGGFVPGINGRRLVRRYRRDLVR